MRVCKRDVSGIFCGFALSFALTSVFCLHVRSKEGCKANGAAFSRVGSLVSGLMLAVVLNSS